MQLKDILTPNEIDEYHRQWKNFKGRYKLNSPYNTHSGMPVISEVYQFPSKTLFKARVFQEKLRGFNPYFIANECHSPFWHSLHYLIVAEQLYHASSNLLRDNSKLFGKDPDIKLKIRKPTFWTVHRAGISVELILESLRKSKDYFVERGNFTIYSDKESEILANVTALAFWQERAYIKEIKAIKAGDKEATSRLIRKTERQDVWQKRLYNPRTNLPDKDFLIAQLKQGKIPESELHDFFSFWDMPK